MATFKVGGAEYSCESISRPSVIEKHQQITIVGASPTLHTILASMFTHLKKKSFKVKAHYGAFKGKFRVLDMPNARVVILKLYDVEDIK